MGAQEIKCMFGFSLNFVSLIAAQILPESLIPYNNHNSVCYGSGTHGQFRPFCPDNDSVIAVQQLRVGSKPIEADCPISVTEWTDHTGSYLVDHSDTSKVLNVTACCFPDEDQDCTFVYNYATSGLEYKYHINSSGYTKSEPNLEVSWEKTSCNNTSNYHSGTNFMYTDYSCIKRTRIGDMCSNGKFTPTDGPFHLYNTDYPSSMEANVGVCQCEIKSDSANIQFYSIDIRLEKYGNECKQTFNVTDSEGTVYWDCESAPIFNVTKLTKNQVVTITFRNNLPVDGGHVWIGFSGDSDDTLTIDCTHQLKQVRVQSTTPLHSTNSAQATRLSTDELTIVQDSTIEQESTTSTVETTNHELVATDSTSSFYKTTIFTGPSPSITKTTVTAIATTRVHESTKETTNTDVSESTTENTTVSNVKTTSTTKNTITDDKTGTREPVTTTKGASSIPDPFATSTQNIIPTTQLLTEQLKIVIKESRQLPIMITILLLVGLMFIVVIVHRLIKRNRRKRQLIKPQNVEETCVTHDTTFRQSTHYREETRAKTPSNKRYENLVIEIPDRATTRNSPSEERISECSSPSQVSVIGTTLLDDISLQGKEIQRKKDVNDAEKTAKGKQRDDNNVTLLDSREAIKCTHDNTVLRTEPKEQDQTNERSEGKTDQQLPMRRADSPKRRNLSKRKRKRRRKGKRNM